MNTKIIIGLILALIAVSALWLFMAPKDTFPIPSGETVPLAEDEQEGEIMTTEDREEDGVVETGGETITTTEGRTRTVSVTDGVRHSIPLNEILSGGPGKDGIPSIDSPVFIPVDAATFLDDADIGIGLTVNDESRFYPYRILVWHEIVNDTVGGEPVLVTYCPLCATGIVFERRVNGEVQEFGVSGMLWQSNLLMYNRAVTEADESLWSQVLGEAVLGVDTGAKLPIVRSDIVRWGDWKVAKPDTEVLSEDTGAFRDYGRDPYGDYYTSESVSFGATFSDTRLHPKALVHGIEIDGRFKAYHDDTLKNAVGTIEDTFAGKNITITVNDIGEVRFMANGEVLPSIPGFWFSWIAVHPETELFQ